MVVMLKQCCCGCSLRTGTLTLGILSLIAAIAGLILYSYSAYQDAVMLDHFNASDVADKESHIYLYTTKRVTDIIASLLSVALLIVTLFLLVGINKERAGYIMPWVVYSVVNLAIYVILQIVVIIGLFVMGMAGGAVVLIVIVLLITALDTYFILVVYSYYRELRGESVSGMKA